LLNFIAHVKLTILKNQILGKDFPSMNEKDLKRYLRAHRLRDEWRVCVDGKIDPKVVKIATLMTRRKQYQGKQVHVLHASLKKPEASAWMPFEFWDSEGASGLRLQPTTKAPSKPTYSPMSKPEAARAEEAQVDPLETLTAEVVAMRRAMNEWQCTMSDMMQKINDLSDSVNTNMCTVNDVDRGVMLDAKASELAIRERELDRRENYISKCENRLIDMTYQQEETAVELALLSEGKRIPR